ncbi:PDDEXK nuclease domain-containing protein [Arthrobacter sp. UYEF36]|uniref:PDDEXK nuclease domain-containing protein n=1 Tax=Arthrobacter sp. UYEF36 TaxID=1756366 RepID=UPI003397D81D
MRSTGYVVVELKTGKFRPEHLGQLNYYVTVVNDKMRLPRQRPTVGILADP